MSASSHMIMIMLSYLQLLPHSIRVFRKGHYLFHQGDIITSMFLIETGEAQLLRRHRNGNAIVLQRATMGSCLAEASLFAVTYHCDAVAGKRLQVRIIARDVIKSLFESDVSFARSWANHLADEVRRARLRAELLSLKTVSERLDAWIANNGSLPAKGSWKIIAAEIGTSAEALYREIAIRSHR